MYIAFANVEIGVCKTHMCESSNSKFDWANLSCLVLFHYRPTPLKERTRQGLVREIFNSYCRRYLLTSTLKLALSLELMLMIRRENSCLLLFLE